jgi:signal transduction protein with GAF and PtsI domain
MTSQKSLVDTVHLLSELVVFKSYSFDEFLKKLIKLLNNIIPVDSCLIYFFDKEGKELTLCASKKSHQSLMGKITMKKGEGITGWVAVHEKPSH